MAGDRGIAGAHVDEGIANRQKKLHQWAAQGPPGVPGSQTGITAGLHRCHGGQRPNGVQTRVDARPGMLPNQLRQVHHPLRGGERGLQGTANVGVIRTGGIHNQCQLRAKDWVLTSQGGDSLQNGPAPVGLPATAAVDIDIDQARRQSRVCRRFICEHLTGPGPQIRGDDRRPRTDIAGYVATCWTHAPVLLLRVSGASVSEPDSLLKCLDHIDWSRGRR